MLFSVISRYAGGRTITLITDLVEKAGQQSYAKETRNGIEYTYSGVTMPVAHLFIISVAEQNGDDVSYALGMRHLLFTTAETLTIGFTQH